MEPEGAAIVDLLPKVDEKKRMDKELVQKLELNFEAMKELEEEIRKFEQPALKEQAINLYVFHTLLSYCLVRSKIYSTRERERVFGPSTLYYFSFKKRDLQKALGPCS